MINITQPFEKYPLWVFSGLDFPEIPDDLEYHSMQGENILLQDEKYFKRLIAKDNEYQKEILQEIWLAIEEIKKAPVSTIVKKYFEEYWVCRQWDFKKEELYTEIVKDSKDFHMGTHLDNLYVKFNAMANLKDNVDSTQFHIIPQPTWVNFNKFEKSMTSWTGPTEKGTGYFWFNHPALYHDIHITQDNRMVVKISKDFDI